MGKQIWLSNRKVGFISSAQNFVLSFCYVKRCASRVAPNFSEGNQPDFQGRLPRKIAYKFMLKATSEFFDLWP
jgi:hypothetical protein